MSNKIQLAAFKFLDSLVLLTMVLGMPMSVAAVPQAQDSTPAVATDKSDYAPGESAQASGSGFAAGDYDLAASGPDGVTAWGTVTADAGGGFETDSPALGSAGSYELRAYASPWSGDWNETPVASTSFTVTAPPAPTETPTAEPTQEPTAEPTATSDPTSEPTQGPTATIEPTSEPTATATTEPVTEPTATATADPTETPTSTPAPTGPPTIVSDKDDYYPGELVILTGTNWQGDTEVRIFVNDDVGQTWNRDVIVAVAGDGTIYESFHLPAWFVATYSVTATGQQTSRVATHSFTDSPGSYSLDFSAADPGDVPTYPKVTPSQLACPTPSGGSGRAADPLADAIFGNPVNAVESLAPEDMILGQIVPFETEIRVNGAVTPENGRIKIVMTHLAKTTNGGDFGFDPAFGLYCAFIDTADSGNSTLAAGTKVESFSWTILQPGTNNERIEATIIVSGLVSPERAILETWVVLKSSITAGTTGNVQSSIGPAQTCTNSACTTGSNINTGNQTVPLLRVQEFFTSDADLSITKSDDPDPVVAGSQLTYTVIVTNNGPATANGVVVTDVLDPNTTYVSSSIPCTGSGTLTCNVGNLTVGQSVSFTITVNVSTSAPTSITPGTAAVGGTCTVGSQDLCNVVSVDAINDDPTPGNNSDSEPTNVLPLGGITINKIAVGGDATFSYTTTGSGLSDFNITTSGGSGSQSFTGVAPGAKTVTESGPPAGWDFTSLVCSDPDNGTTVSGQTANIDLDPGESITCTYTNTKRGTIIVEKQTDPDGAAGSFTFTGDAAGTISDNGQIVVSNLVPGTYTSTENDPSPNFALTSILCDDSNSTGNLATRTATFSLEAGETVTCVFTNTQQQGTVVVKKLMVGGTDTFTYSGTPSGSISTDNGTISANVIPGQYTSTETVPAGWDLNSIICDDANSTGDTGTATATFNVEQGETVTCTFTNTKRATIIVKKVMVGGTDTFAYSGTPSGFISTNNGTIQATVVPGAYTSTETVPADWDLTSINCDDANSTGEVGTATATFNAEAGETVTCTFTNEKQTASLTVTKTPDQTDVCTGSTVTYTYEVTNTGTAALTVNLVDDNGTPGNTSDDIDVDGGAGVSLSPGASQTFTATATITGTVTNTVTATGTSAGGQTATGTASATVTSHNCTITVTKAPSATNVCDGGAVTYTYTVTNNSDQFTWTGSLDDDQLGTINGSIVLTPGETQSFTASANITGTVTNTVTASGTFDDDSSTSASDSDSATVSSHDCSITVTKSPSATNVCDGGEVTYTYTVANNSDQFTWSGSLSDDQLGTIAASITLGPGASDTFTASASITGTVTNTATASGTFDDSSSTSASDSDSATVTSHDCSITVTKSPSATDVCDGGSVTYTITVTNNSDLFDWTGDVTDDVLGTLDTNVTIPAGGSVTYTPSHTVSSTATNTVTASGSFNDGSGASASDSASATVTSHECTITVTKSPSATNVCDGGEVTYTYTVTNNSDQFTWSGSLTDNQLGLIAASITLGPGASDTFTASASITGAVTNTATASGTFDDDSATSASDSASATVTSHDCSITVSKTPSAANVCAGGSVTYTITVTNNSDLFDWTGDVTDDVLGTLGTNVTIPAGGSVTYTPSHTVSSTTTNTVTASGAFNDGSSTSASDSASATVTSNTCRIIVKKLTVPGGDPQLFTFSGDLSGSIGHGGTLTLDVLQPGTYSTTETVPAGWDLTDVSCDDANSSGSPATATATYDVAFGETVTCTFTNTKRGTIRIIKDAVPDDPQDFSFTATESTDTTIPDFTLDDDADGTLPNTITFNDLKPGDYTVTETLVAGWDLTGMSCASTVNFNSSVNVTLSTATASVSLGAGDTVICSFRNTKRGHIIVDKVTVPAGDTQSFSFDASGGFNPVYADFNLTDASTPNDQELRPGFYSVSETVPTGWDLTSATCTSSIGDTESPGSIELDPGETVTCTFTNTKRATVIVKKVMVGGTDSFGYTGTPNGVISTNNGSIQAVVVPGQYQSTETVPAGWDLNSISCDDGNSTGNVGTATATFHAEPGETVTCTFTNTRRGKIIVVKQTHPDGSSQQFEFNPSWGANFFLSDGQQNDSGFLVPGTYSVAEVNIPAGWVLAGAVASDGSPVNALSLQAGETITVTFTDVMASSFTNSSLCPIDNDEIRLLYHVEVAPNVYRLQSSNPGQFYYNVFVTGTPGSPVNASIKIPYPFVTQEGAGNPIQVHDGVTLNSGQCFVPSPSLSGFNIATYAMSPTSSSGKQIITMEDYGAAPNPNQLNELTTVTVSGNIPSTGLLYVTIHLDYGLKKTGGWTRNGEKAVGSGANTGITINEPQSYNFSFMYGANTFTSTPHSVNDFKKFAGFMGFVTVGGNPVAGLQVRIYKPDGSTLTTVNTDADGFYFYAYQHKAKSATYKLRLLAYYPSTPDVSVTVKSNGFAVVNFTVP